MAFRGLWSFLGQALRRCTPLAVRALLWTGLAAGVGMLPAPFGAMASASTGIAFMYLQGFCGPKKRSRALLEVRWTPLRRGAGWVIGAVVSLETFAFGYITLLAQLQGAAAPSAPTLVAKTSLITICLVGPVIEEVFFRGWMLRRLEAVMERVPALLVSAVVFAIIHLQPASMPYRAVVGVVAALAVYETRSLWGGILVHMGNNIFVVAFWGLHLDVKALTVSRPLAVLLLSIGCAGLAVAWMAARPAIRPRRAPTNESAGVRQLPA